MRGFAVLFVAVCAVCVFDEGEAYQPLQVEGQGGFWNQVVVGKDKAYASRIGGLTVRGQKPVVSFLDRETPREFAKRWDITTERNQLSMYRGMKTKLMGLDSQGNAVFVGKMKVDGVLRVKNLALEGVKATASDGTSTLSIGTDQTSSFKMGSSDKSAWIQSNKGEPLTFNPRVQDVKRGTAMFGYHVPKHTVDAKADVHIVNSLKLGAAGKTVLTSDKLTFAMGGGWSSTDPLWISSHKTKPVQFGGGVFGTRLGIGIECSKKFRMQVHNGHFVVTGKVGPLLKGLTTYVTPTGSHVRAYDYTRKKLQKWRITGTKVLLNPDQKEDGRVCIGCSKPEHHLQSEGNMYVNGNVYVNKHLHVKGHMHIDKIITPKVFVHSKIETPKYGRGIMIGNDLPNRWKTKTNMRIGYNKQYAWIQSHAEVPLTLNPIGGATCISCTKPAKGIELQLGMDGFVAGELFVATLKKKKKKAKKGAQPEPASRRLLSLDDTQELTLAEAKAGLAREMEAEQINVKSAWASASKIVQHNHAAIDSRQKEIERNEGAIASLERQFAALLAK